MGGWRFAKVSAGRDGSSMAQAEGSTCRLIFQVRIDPFLDAKAALIFWVEANSEILGLAPGDGSTHPDSGQGQQCKRDFNRRTRSNFVRRVHRHAAGAEVTAGRGDTTVVSGGYC